MSKFGKIRLNDDELEDLKWTLSIVKQVGTTHFGLGARAAFMNAVALAEMACVQVGTMGIGKTKVIECIEGMARRGTSWEIVTEEFTLAGISKRLNKMFSNGRVLWTSKDLAKLSTTVQENMLKVVSALITDRECRISTSMYKCEITNSTISWLGACTYEVFNLLMDSSLWRGMYQDRILRYHAFQPERRGINTDIPFAEYKYNLPRNIEVPEDKNFGRIVDLLENQFTYERSYEYAERLLKGMARMNHRSQVLPADCKFIMLHTFQLSAEAHIAYRDTISSPLYIDTDSLLILSEAVKRGGVTVNFLSNKYHTDEESILETADYAGDLVSIIDGGNRIVPSRFVNNSLKSLMNFERLVVDEDSFYAPTSKKRLSRKRLKRKG